MEPGLEKALSEAVSKVLAKFKPLDTDTSGDEECFGPSRKKKISKRRRDGSEESSNHKRKKLPLPSAFLSSLQQKRSREVKRSERVFTYDRDIVCLPKSLADKDGLVKIPRKKEFFASNKLIGKIRLKSTMTESDIMDEIRSVFRKPMNEDLLFRFEILQHSGFGSKCLSIPEVSSSYEWSASSVAGKNPKSPIYILALDKLKLQAVSDSSESGASGEENDFPEVNLKPNSIVEEHKDILPINRNIDTTHKKGQESNSSSRYNDYISLLSDDDSEYVVSPSPPPVSPLTPCIDRDGGEVKDLLRSLHVKHLPADRSQCQRLIVRRKHVFDDALHRYRSGIDLNKYIKVTFVGEPAADEGGPLREFFHLLVQDISRNSNLFCGEEGNRVPQVNAVELKKQTYLKVGEMLATSLVHRGPAPHLFSEAVADYILYGMKKVRVTVNDVPDHDVRAKLIKLQNICDGGALQELMDSEEFQFRYDLGIGQSSKSLTIYDRDKIFNLIASHFAVIRVKAELDQLLQGLESLGVLDIFRRNPVKMRILLVKKNPVRYNADSFLDLLVPLLSLEGSNQREAEEATMILWANFVQLIESGSGNVEGLSPDGDFVKFNITFEDILGFITGCPTEPPSGFDPLPTIKFQRTSLYPRANTCSNAIQLPLGHSSFESFVYFISYGILNTAGFGTI